MPNRTRTVRAPLALLLGTMLLGACNYSNPHGSQALPPVTRLVTEPAGCEVYVKRLNLLLESPCDLPETVEADDTITVTKAGYASYQGKLAALPQVSLGTYKCVLPK